MKITKLGHCCLVIEHKGVTILTDPGTYTTAQNNVKGIDIIVISHEHADHFHLESLKKVLANNANAHVITNKAVGAHLEKEGIAFTVVGDNNALDIKGIHIEGHGTQHAEIYKEIGQVENTSYFIDELFYPGDAFYNPNKSVSILALPTAGPWVKVKDVIDYALLVRPKVAFPVHDAGLLSPGLNARTPEMVLTKEGIKFIILPIGEAVEL